MKKERAIAFTDALLAIIMTILVLELKAPQTLNWQGLWALRASYFSYALSFFWLGTMWIGLHSQWENVEQISVSTLWMTLLLLFFASFFPYTTKIVSTHFMNKTAQAMYGIIALLTTVANLVLGMSLCRIPANKSIVKASQFRQKWLLIDIGIKTIGVILAATVYPPAAMYGVLISALVVAIPAHTFEAVSTSAKVSSSTQPSSKSSAKASAKKTA